MSTIICFETSTNVCSVSLSINGVVTYFKETNRIKSHASLLNNFINDLLIENDITLKNVDAIAVSSGPGSYTGLRIGSSTAKGLCYSLNIPLIAINTLEVMTAGILNENAAANANTLFAPVLDARRMEVFIALYNNNLQTILPTQPYVLDNELLQEYKEEEILIFGNASEKCETFYSDKKFKYNHEFNISAKHMAQLAYTKFTENNFEDISYFEPNYGKAFYSNSLIAKN